MIKIEIRISEDIERLGTEFKRSGINFSAGKRLFFIQVHLLFNHPNVFRLRFVVGMALWLPWHLSLYWRGDRLDHQFLWLFSGTKRLDGSIPLCLRHGGRLDSEYLMILFSLPILGGVLNNIQPRF